MPTRFYFPLDANTSGLTPDWYDPGFGTSYTAEAVRRDLARVKGTETLTVGTVIGAWTSSGNGMDRCYISEALASQQLPAGMTVKAQLMVREYANTDNVDTAYIVVSVCDSAGVIRDHMISVASVQSEFINATSHRNVSLTGTLPAPYNNFQINAGDRLLLYVFYTDSAGTTPEASAKWGNTNLTDLPENDTQTTDGNPWVEFSYDFTFSGGAQALTATLFTEGADSFGANAIDATVRYFPQNDVSVGAWTTDTGGATNLFSRVNESSPDDASFIRSETSPNASKVEVGFGSLGDPVKHTGHVLSVRFARNDTANALNITFRLKQGVTVIASWTLTNVSNTLVTADLALTPAQAAAITDYTNLRLEAEATQV